MIGVFCISRPTSADQTILEESSLDHGQQTADQKEEPGEEGDDKEEEKVEILVGDLIDISSDPGIANLRYLNHTIPLRTLKQFHSIFNSNNGTI